MQGRKPILPAVAERVSLPVAQDDPRVEGWNARPCIGTIAPMKIKQSQIYGWDEEPVDERPSEFSSTSGHSLHSGYHSLGEPRRARRSSGRLGFKSLIVFCAVVLTLGVWTLVKLAPLLRA